MSLTKITPPAELSEEDRDTIFRHGFHRLAEYRNKVVLYGTMEAALKPSPQSEQISEAYAAEINKWAHDLLSNIWVATGEPGGGECPSINDMTDTSTRHLPPLPSIDMVSRIMNAVLFLHVTTAKAYHAHTRAFLTTFAPLDERTVVQTLKNPSKAVEETQQATDKAKEKHAQQSKTWRIAGTGLAAVTGGVVIGLTGGLAAPLVGAGLSTVLGALGVGGTGAALLATGLASSSVVCGALFGAYGAKSAATMIERHTREVRDLALIRVGDPPEDESLGVRLCVTGWLASISDVTAPWTVFRGDETFALRFEVEALQDLSNAFYTLVKKQMFTMLKGEIIKRTILASLMSALSPVAILKIGQIIDNPWANAEARAAKAGAVLGDLLHSRVFGNRPVTLSGFSLGSTVIFEALKYLAKLPPAETVGLINDVFVFGTPAPANDATWASIRRLVSGRLVNGYSQNDYILAVLSRATDASWDISGLKPIEGVQDVENVDCQQVDGHLKWRGLIGSCLKDCNAPDIIASEVSRQLAEVEESIERDLASNSKDAAK